MLYVQFDAGASEVAGGAVLAGARALMRARHLDDVLAGLELRAAEPAIMVLRCAVVLALGPEAIVRCTWSERGLDGARGFTLAMGNRESDGRFPLGVAAFARDHERLAAWLAASGVQSARHGELIAAGAPCLADLALDAAQEPWMQTLASDAPYLEIVVSFGHARSLGALWAAASRRGARFQVEGVASLPGLPPLHVIARDPPEDVSEILPPGHEPPVVLRRSASAESELPAEREGPPTWDEPGPCDCGVPPDLCAMKRFRLAPAEGAPTSDLPGADILRQLSAAIVDLHVVRETRVQGLMPGDRVLVARSPESIAALAPEDVVLDASGAALPLRQAGEIYGAVLAVLPWPSIFEEGAFRRTFSGLW